MEFLVKYINENIDNEENKPVAPATVFDLFQKSEIKQYYIRNIDDYCRLLIEVIEQIVEKDEFLLFLNNQNLFAKVLVETDKFRDEFLGKILTVLIENMVKYENDIKIFKSISNLVIKCIFNKNMQSFDCYLNQHPATQCTDEHTLCKKVLEFLERSYSKEIAAYSFKIIYQSFFTSYQNNFNLNYKMLIIIFNLIGFNVKNHFKVKGFLRVKISKLDFNRTLEITNQLFDCLSDLKIDNNHKINDITINDFITNILKSIIPLTQDPNSYCYDIIAKIIDFMPLIISTLIDDIIVYIVITNNAGILEKYCQVFSKIFELHSKLHRFDFFISRLIRVLHDNYYKGRQLNKTIYEFNNIVIQMKEISYNIDEILPKVVLDSFTNCIVTNYSKLTMAVLRTIIFHFNEVVDEMQQNYDKPLIYIEVVTTLLCQLLNSIRVEHTTSLANIQKLDNHLNELGATLNKFYNILLKQEHNHTLMRTFLNVCYHWGELHMILVYYWPDDLTLIKQKHNDSTACNITYLHHYLSKQQWCLISERVRNFGEKPCKGIMYKLMIQKLRAMTIFDDINDDVITPIIKELYTTIDEDTVDLTTMKFVVNHLISKLPPNTIIKICEQILNDLIDNRNNHLLNQSHIYDNQLIINGLIYNIFIKMNKLLKQKRRHNDETIKKSLLTKIMKIPIDDYLFSNQEVNEILPTIVQYFNEHNNEQLLDIKIDDDKILKLIEIFRRLPVVSCNEDNKKIVFLLLLALFNDLCSSNCSDELKIACETVIIGIAQCCKLPLVEIVSSNLLEIILTKFNRFDVLYGYLIDKIYKNHQFISQIQTGIDYLIENLNDDRHLKCTVITLEAIKKTKRNRLENSIKSLCITQENLIYKKLFKILKKHEINNNLIKPYALALKHFMKDDEKLTILQTRLDEFVEFVFNNYNKDNFDLFTTILNNKSTVNYEEDLILKIWNYLRNIEVNDNFNECTQLMSLIVMQISDEKFSQIIKDLFEFTINAIDNGDFDSVFKLLEIWISIVKCNLSLKRTAKFHEEFEKLLHSLITAIKTVDYKEDIFDELTKLVITTIQTKRLTLTSDIMDSFFVYTTVLITTSNQSNCIHLFNLSISIIDNLLIHRSALIMDRLSVYLLQYRLLLKHLCIYSTDTNNEQDFINQLSNCSLKLEKLTRTLITHPKDMARITPYLIADILAQYELRSIHSQIKLHLDNCVYLLISLCDQHAVQFLMTFLSNASTEIFKLMYKNYKKYYQFKGKI